MGRRRRKKIIKIPKPKIPEVFVCPLCGSRSLTVKLDKKNSMAEVRCGSCGLHWSTKVEGYEEKIDVYHKFFDAFVEGKLEESMYAG